MKDLLHNRFFRTTLLLLAIACFVTAHASAQSVAPVIRAVPPQDEPAASKGAAGSQIYEFGDAEDTRIQGVPSALFDLDSVSWASYRDATSAQFSDHFAAMKDDYLMLDIEVDEVNGNQQVAAVWQANFDGRGWAEMRNLTHEQFSEQWTKYRDLEYRLIDQESYVLNDTRYYAGIWIENREELAWVSYRNVTSEEFSNRFATYSEDGYIMVDVEAYPIDNGDQLRYAAAWVENAENLAWIEKRGMTSAEFSEEFQKNRDRYRVWDIESYYFNGTQYYAAIWIENRNGRGWFEVRDMTASAYRNRWYRYRDLGYRLTNFEKYETAGGYRYAGVWRQNNDRRDWPLRTQVDALVEDERAEFDVPGVGVGIAVGDEIVYLRGFGFGDEDENVWYSSRTVNRLASISKAIGGVLAVRLAEKGAIDLDDPTRDYQPQLPAAHDHTIRQLLANRGGLGHYDEHGAVNAPFTTAWDGVQFFLDDDLPYQPGRGCLYSTHGSSLPAVAYEAATGKTIFKIIEDELTEPLGLPTLKAEDRGEATIDWAELYNTDNTVATPDLLDWKTLGGGLVASPYDLLRFGMKLIDGEIVSPDGLDELWTVPAPDCSNYALGWNTGTDDGALVYAKNGGQPGANTYIRIYPEIDAVIVVLFNRQGGGQSAVQVGRDIGSLLLDAYFVPDEEEPTAAETPGERSGPSLAPAYPNPFRETATLTYTLGEAGPVAVSVYDLLGRRVATLRDGHLPAGMHALVWDGTDDAGAALASGMYLVRLTAGTRQETVRVILSR